MDKEVKEWLEKKKQQVGQVPPEQPHEETAEPKAETVPEEKPPMPKKPETVPKDIVKDEKIEAEPPKAPSVASKAPSLPKPLAKHPDAEHSIVEERLRKVSDLPDKAPEPKMNLFGLNRRRIMIIIVASLVGGLVGYMLFTFIFG